MIPSVFVWVFLFSPHVSFFWRRVHAQGGGDARAWARLSSYGAVCAVCTQPNAPARRGISFICWRTALHALRLNGVKLRDERRLVQTLEGGGREVLPACKGKETAASIICMDPAICGVA